MEKQLEPSAAPGGVQLKPGDRVLVRQHPMGRHKLADRYHDVPAEVITVPSETGGCFKLQHPDGQISRQHGCNLCRYLEAMPLNTEEVQNPRESASTMTEMLNNSRDKTIITNNQRQRTFQTNDDQKTREPRLPATEDARDPQERDMNTYTIVKMASWPGDSQRGPMAPRLVHAGPPPVPAPRRSARAVKPTERLITTV